MNEINELMKSVDNVERVQKGSIGLDEALGKFLAAHQIYHSQLVDEDDKQESEAYGDVERLRVAEFKDKIDFWLKTCQHGGNDSSNEINPKDSASNVDSDFGSRMSRRSKSTRRDANSVISSRVSSRSSAVNAKVAAAARKAALREEALRLRRRQALQQEELRLQQRKEELELETEIAKIAAEERAYSEVGASECNENAPLNPYRVRPHERSSSIDGIDLIPSKHEAPLRTSHECQERSPDIGHSQSMALNHHATEW